MAFSVNPHNPPKQIPLDRVKAWPVTTQADKEHWNRLVETHHYLKDATLCGPLIRYVVSYGVPAPAFRTCNIGVLTHYLFPAIFAYF